MISLEQFRDFFKNRFHQEPEVIARAPGRVNLIGEHTDYNEGYVLPVAIHREVWVGASRRNDRTLTAYSMEHSELRSIAIESLGRTKDPSWIDYPAGVAAEMLAQGLALGGSNLLIAGDVPVGAGLSSSAAVLISTITAWKYLFALPLSGMELIRMGQRAENAYVGVACGIMDHYVSAAGKEGHALLIDCRDLGSELVLLPPDLAILVCDTGVRRDLATSEYNRRRQECEAGVAIFRTAASSVRSLRDVSPNLLREFLPRLPEKVAHRCRHVISENQRVLLAVEALRKGDESALGRLMRQSHESLRSDYEVSCEELDAMVDITFEQQGVVGSRMTGAGFGGCTVTLLRTEDAPLAAERIRAGYAKRFSHPVATYVCRSADGASLVEN